MVPQETVIFAASARDNLRYGNWTATDEELWEAARAANAEEFLRKLPQGLDTFMGEGGARLSGGQRQRIADRKRVVWGTSVSVCVDLGGGRCIKKKTYKLHMKS